MASKKFKLQQQKDKSEKKWKSWQFIGMGNLRNQSWGKMDAILEMTFSIAFSRISNKFSQKFIHKSPIKNIPTLVQIMAWHRLDHNPLSEPTMIRLPTRHSASVCKLISWRLRMRCCGLIVVNSRISDPFNIYPLCNGTNSNQRHLAFTLS